MNKRANLVIVRAGDASLHPGWLDGAGPRNWDIIVSYFGRDPDRYRVPDVTRIDGPGMKWPALHDLLTTRPEILDGYDYIWLPDDDLAATAPDINRMFALCAKYTLDLAQPALAWDSYFSHLVTLRNAGLLLRRTNFVEVMAPVFSAAMLRRVLPTFTATRTGWGLDHIWPRYATDPANGVAIIDAVTVRHTRPIGGPNYAKLREEGISPWDELRSFYRDQGLGEGLEIATYRVVPNQGAPIAADRSRYLAFRLLLGHLPALRSTPFRGFAARKLLAFARDNLRTRPTGAVERFFPFRN